jgi:hypothetical protein
MWTRVAILASVAVSTWLGACDSTSPSSQNEDPALVVTPSRAELPAGQFLQLIAALRNGGGLGFTPDQIVWTSSDTRIATVVGGMVYGAQVGSVQIAATWRALRTTAQVSVSAAEVRPAPCVPVAARVERAEADLAAETVRRTCGQREPVEIQ